MASRHAIGEAVTLRMSSDPRLLCVLRGVVRSFCGLAGFDEVRSAAITLAVDESLANVIRHAYAGRTDGEIEVACGIEDGGAQGRVLVVCVRDQGRPAPEDLLACQAARDPLVPGGLGLHLIRGVMDDVELTGCAEGGNVLRLSIACPPPAAGTA